VATGMEYAFLEVVIPNNHMVNIFRACPTRLAGERAPDQLTGENLAGWNKQPHHLSLTLDYQKPHGSCEPITSLFRTSEPQRIGMALSHVQSDIR
jgi:hypothetical protein